MKSLKSCIVLIASILHLLKFINYIIIIGIKAEEHTLEDEWMKEDEWEAVYQQEEKNNGKV